jgi:O-antigen/teichoic acid export membrane protein
MRKPHLMNSIKMRVGFEAGVFFISVAAIACIALALHIKPDLLGNNVAQVAPYMAIVLLVPAFRNLIEYQAELLYGRGQSFQRLLNYFVLGILKAVLLVWLLATYDTPAEWMIWINGVFAGLYAASLLLTYTSLKKPAIRI